MTISFSPALGRRSSLLGSENSKKLGIKKGEGYCGSLENIEI